MAEEMVTAGGDPLVRGRCPRCGKAIEWAAGGGPLAKGNLYRPFCSERCKLIDLGKWIDEEYRIAGENPPSKETGEGRGGGRRR
jgi:endogenous inhibitor of DNA gyrase (YacG/DUF329 family)